MESLVLSNKFLLTVNERIHKFHNYLAYFMISFSHINYVFFVNKEIGIVCKVCCTFNL